MKFLTKKIYIIFFIISIYLLNSVAFGKNKEIQYSKDDISNYFSGIVLAKQSNNNDLAFKHLKKVKSLKNIHSNFNVEFIRTLVLVEKFDKAYAFSKDIWDENELFFEADLILGLKLFNKKEYSDAEKYFHRLNKTSIHNIFFKDFVGNILIAWSRAAQGNKNDSFEYIEKIPKKYNNLTKIQKVFLKCYFDSNEVEKSFNELIKNEDYNFSRYNFFLSNYLLSKNENHKAKKLLIMEEKSTVQIYL